jgi:monofunctional biosynthetic peptidoglycan transglycosylase
MSKRSLYQGLGWAILLLLALLLFDCGRWLSAPACMPWPGLLWQIPTALLLALALLIFSLRFINPPITAFIYRTGLALRKKAELPRHDVRQSWVPLSAISAPLLNVILQAEDSHFYHHFGINFESIDKAIRSQLSGPGNVGSSTISQQTAKNLFLWTGRQWPVRILRKLPELVLTFLIEVLWTKDRILAVYVNVVQFTPNEFGVEAASQELLGKPASDVTEAEAVRIVALLPNPWIRSYHHPQEYLIAYQNRIQAALDETKTGRGTKPQRVIERDSRG